MEMVFAVLLTALGSLVFVLIFVFMMISTLSDEDSKGLQRHLLGKVQGGVLESEAAKRQLFRSYLVAHVPSCQRTEDAGKPDIMHVMTTHGSVLIGLKRGLTPAFVEYSINESPSWLTVQAKDPAQDSMHLSIHGIEFLADPRTLSTMISSEIAVRPEGTVMWGHGEMRAQCTEGDTSSWCESFAHQVVRLLNWSDRLVETLPVNGILGMIRVLQRASEASQRERAQGMLGALLRKDETHQGLEAFLEHCSLDELLVLMNLDAAHQEVLLAKFDALDIPHWKWFKLVHDLRARQVRPTAGGGAQITLERLVPDAPALLHVQLKRVPTSALLDSSFQDMSRAIVPALWLYSSRQGVDDALLAHVEALAGVLSGDDLFLLLTMLEAWGVRPVLTEARLGSLSPTRLDDDARARVIRWIFDAVRADPMVLKSSRWSVTAVRWVRPMSPEQVNNVAQALEMIGHVDAFQEIGAILDQGGPPHLIEPLRRAHEAMRQRAAKGGSLSLAAGEAGGLSVTPSEDEGSRGS